MMTLYARSVRLSSRGLRTFVLLLLVVILLQRDRYIYFFFSGKGNLSKFVLTFFLNFVFIVLCNVQLFDTS